MFSFVIGAHKTKQFEATVKYLSRDQSSVTDPRPCGNKAHHRNIRPLPRDQSWVLDHTETKHTSVTVADVDGGTAGSSTVTLTTLRNMFQSGQVTDPRFSV